MILRERGQMNRKERGQDDAQLQKPRDPRDQNDAKEADGNVSSGCANCKSFLSNY